MSFFPTLSAAHHPTPPLRSLFICLLTALAFGPTLHPSPAQAAELEFGGELSSSFGVFLFSCAPDCLLLDYQNRNIVNLHLDAYLNPSVTARVALSLRNENNPEIRRAEDTGNLDNLQPIEMRISDAWLEGYDLFLPGLDLRVGAQRIPWGTGDGFSPSDRLNPFDLSDPTRFDQRLATPAVRADYHLQDFTFTAAWIPYFIPSLISPRVIDVIAGPDGADNIDFDVHVEGDAPRINRVSTRLILPPQTLSDGSYAFRIHWAHPRVDAALGYYYGRDHLPQLSGEVFPENFFDGESTDLVLTLRYPRIQMLSLEARAPLFGSWTGWLDAALLFPSRTRVFISQSRLRDLERLGAIDEAPDGDISTIVQTGEPYLNFLIGADTSLGSHLYLNFQYIHGFLFERNPDELHHYFLVGLRAPTTDSAVEFQARAGAEANRHFDRFGFLTQLELTYRHADLLELFGSTSLQLGQAGTTLGRFAGLSEVRLGARAHF